MFYEGARYEARGVTKPRAYEAEGLRGEASRSRAEAEQAYEYEAWEMEMAAELLAVRDEAELEQFLGGLIKGVRGLSGLAKKAAPVLLPALKSVAKAALPVVGGALGGLVGGPTEPSAASSPHGGRHVWARARRVSASEDRSSKPRSSSSGSPTTRRTPWARRPITTPARSRPRTPP